MFACEEISRTGSLWAMTAPVVLGVIFCPQAHLQSREASKESLGSKAHLPSVSRSGDLTESIKWPYEKYIGTAISSDL